jgi:hypothetical protein
MMNLTLSKDRDDEKVTRLRTLMSDGTQIPAAADAVRTAIEEAVVKRGACPQCGGRWDNKHNRCKAQCDASEKQ